MVCRHPHSRGNLVATGSKDLGESPQNDFSLKGSKTKAVDFNVWDQRHLHKKHIKKKKVVYVEKDVSRI